uniref:Peroxisomal biosis factor 13 n=2 Tax=Sus scrofa TaxID=9823 RepID=A0A8D0S206_PIG
MASQPPPPPKPWETRRIPGAGPGPGPGPTFQLWFVAAQRGICPAPLIGNKVS